MGWQAQGADGTARQDQRCEVIDSDLAKLDHEAKDARERAALAAVEPGSIDLDHSRGAERLEVSINQPEQGESGKGPGKGGDPLDEVDEDGARGSDDHRGPTADGIAEKAVD